MTDVETLISRSEGLLKQRALEKAPFGVTIADVQADDEPLIYANEGFTTMTGYSNDEILGRNCRFLQGEATREEPVRAMREAIDGGESVQVELRNYRKDGEQFWNEVTLSPLKHDGEITHYVGVQQDVTRRKEYEQELEDQRDDLNVLNQMVRHDIRNDLQVALVSLELLEERYDDEQVQTALESIRQAVELTNTARDVADAMLGSEQAEKAVDLGATITTELDEVAATYPDAQLRVEGSLPAVDVRANDLLGSVFQNLLTNAVRHNDSETPTVVVTATMTDEEVVVTVSDNGPGISGDERDHLFERGWHSSASNGTGMGLYIAAKIVRSYGGELTADTPEGEGADLGGATFTVRLPLAA